MTEGFNLEHNRVPGFPLKGDLSARDAALAASDRALSEQARRDAKEALSGLSRKQIDELVDEMFAGVEGGGDHETN